MSKNFSVKRPSAPGAVQQDLTLPPPRTPYARGSKTSQAAADSIAPGAGTLLEEVLHVIRVAGANGRTIDEVEVETGLTHQTASARVNDLMKRNLIADSGQTRPTRSGRKAVVWIVT